MRLDDSYVELTQWDTGRKIILDSYEICDQVHFSNKSFGKTIDVKVYKLEDSYVADIPDELLQSPSPLTIYCYITRDDGETTTVSQTFFVRKRNKPTDYIYEPEPQTKIKEFYEFVNYTIDEINNIAQEVEEATTHQPIIQNGTWWTWDSDNNCYIDTGVLSKGEDGLDGKDAIINGYTTITIKAGENITIDQQDDELTIKSPISKASIGLENVDNTSDINKPVSTAQKNTIESAKTLSIQESKNYTDEKLQESKDYTDTEIRETTIRLWQPNTEYKAGEFVSYIDNEGLVEFCKCTEAHVSSTTISYSEFNNVSVQHARYSGIAENATMASADLYGNFIPDTYARKDELTSYSQKPTIITDSTSTSYTIEFLGSTNKIIRLTAAALSELNLTFHDGEYNADLIVNVVFNSGDTPTQISYPNTGILNWIGTDCALPAGKSVFTPSANTRYDIVFSFDGSQLVGYVCGYTPATVSNG